MIPRKTTILLLCGLMATFCVARVWRGDDERVMKGDDEDENIEEVDEDNQSGEETFDDDDEQRGSVVPDDDVWHSKEKREAGEDSQISDKVLKITKRKRRNAEDEISDKVVKRSANRLADLQVTLIGGKGGPITRKSERTRRAAVNSTTKTWPHSIPFVIDTATYNVPIDVSRFKRVLRWISQRLCVQFHDETDNYDPNDPSWFSSNGYETNAYLFVQKTSGCTAKLGRGNGQGGKSIKPCKDFKINMHEILHSLGVTHSQSARQRTDYMEINLQDIKSNSWGSYGVSNDPNLVDYFFDSMSTMMYTDKTWTANGIETYFPIRDDFFHLVQMFPNENAVLFELNQIYQCNELYCPDTANTDCGNGYHTLFKGVCQCVCPNDLDPATNCQTQINGPNPRVSWPDTPMVVLAGDSCPDGFNPTPGILPITGNYRPNEEPVPVPLTRVQKTLEFPFCTRDVPAESIDWTSWPDGAKYCFIKPSGTECGGDFEQGTLDLTSTVEPVPSGDLGDITVNGFAVTWNFCCIKKDKSDMYIELPDKDSFRLIGNGQCPNIRGLMYRKSRIDLWIGGSTKSGQQPPSNVKTNTGSTAISECYYQPPVYDCNQWVTLDDTTTSVTIQTPGYAAGLREPNRRCFYNFNVPENTQIRVTFSEFDLHVKDLFYVKRFHKWQDPYKINNLNWPHQFISEKEYLCLEFWSSFETAAGKGANFTVDLIRPEDYCYSLTDRGEDYLGPKHVTETYEECIPWAEAATCDGFPFDSIGGLSLLSSGNECRNPDGSLPFPWCYVFVNDTVCQKRFCDVCNFKHPIDVLENCADLIAANPDFCNSAIERFGCSASCGFSQDSYNPGSCDAPTIAVGTPVGELQASYKQGEKVNISCADGITWDEIICTGSGWRGLSNACSASCEDKLETCEDVLAAFPSFCSDDRSANGATRFCQKTCGGCGAPAQCSAPTSTTYTSGEPTVDQGGVMTFACNADLYHVSGDLNRACSPSGSLLGDEPVCQATPVGQDVKLGMLRRRKETLKKNRAVLLDHDGYRIPFAGKITKWYYYCATSGTLNLLVYRPNGGSYSYVGANTVVCGSDWKMTYNVPAADQIAVQQGDVFGVQSPDLDTLSVSICDSAPNKILQLPSASASTLESLTTQTSFSGSDCLVPSLAIRVEP